MLRLLKGTLILILSGIAPLTTFGQNTGNNGNVGGIRIDADGVIGMAIQQDRGVKLDKKLKATLAKQVVAGDVSQPSPARMVSLVRLEEACQQALAGKKPLPLEIACLAGLTQIDHVFVDLDEKDLILSGPAEPFVQGESGRWIGLETGRPVLLLDDLLVALRSVSLNQVVGCSIDPVPARLAALQRFLKENSSPATPEVIGLRYKKMTEIMGLYDVKITGVPDDSHFARGLVEADYRMKLLTLGLEKPGVKGFKSHLALTNTAQASHRWWFVPLYDRILRSADGLAYEFSGQRAQLLGEDELANEAGQRSPAATNKVSTNGYARQFTDKFPEIAANMPVFAELQQLIDWTVLAALIRQERLAERIDWSMSLFQDAEKLPHEKWPVPKQVPCLMNTKTGRGGAIIAEHSGGVTIQPGDVLRKISARNEGSEELSQRRTKALDRSSNEKHPWWWD